VAQALAAPLDVLVVRKLGAPGNPELAMGAIGEDGVCVLDAEVIDRNGVRADQVSAVAERERAVLQARAVRLRRDRGRCELHGRTAVIVDDGMATGCTARAACRSARRRGATRVVLAVPVAPADTVRTFADADEVVCVLAPERFGAVSAYYRDFGQTDEDDVVALQQRHHPTTAQALMTRRSSSLLVIAILRGFACSATGICSVSTPPS